MEISGPLPAPSEANGDTGKAVMTPVPDEEVGTKPLVSPRVGGALSIASCLLNPEGTDRGRETITLRNRGRTEGLLEGWTLKDRIGKTDKLSGTVPSRGTRVVRLSGKGVRLNNTRDVYSCLVPTGFLSVTSSITRLTPLRGILSNLNGQYSDSRNRAVRRA